MKRGKPQAYPYGHKMRPTDPLQQQDVIDRGRTFGWWVGAYDTWTGWSETSTPSTDPWADSGAIDGNNKD